MRDITTQYALLRTKYNFATVNLPLPVVGFKQLSCQSHCPDLGRLIHASDRGRILFMAANQLLAGTDGRA